MILRLAMIAYDRPWTTRRKPKSSSSSPWIDALHASTVLAYIYL